jgi:hypothetical protein
MTALYLDCYAIITMDTNLSNNNEKCLKTGLKSRIPKTFFTYSSLNKIPTNHVKLLFIIPAP